MELFKGNQLGYFLENNLLHNSCNFKIHATNHNSWTRKFRMWLKGLEMI